MNEPHLIPYPRSLSLAGGSANFSRLAPHARIVTLGGQQEALASSYEAAARMLHTAAGYLAQEFIAPDLIDPGQSGVLDGAVALVLSEDNSGLGEEGYRLTVTDGARIEAATAAGVFYGIQTLGQLLEMKDGQLVAPRCEIEDWPEWGWRGVMLDQGRNYQSPDFLKRQIDIAAKYKLNRFHFHPTEYPGWRVQIRSFPDLKSEKYYTQEELIDLVEYAQARFVTIVPEIEMPGHCTAFLDLMPHLKCTNDTMCMGSEELYATLETILTEVAAIFPSPWIHIGTDECEGGEGCPKCEAVVQRLGELEGAPTLMGYFISRMNEIVKGLGRKAITWNDQMSGGIPQDVVIHSWMTGSDAPATARAGYETINSHARDVYFDHGSTPDYVPRIFAWSPNEGEPLPIPNLLGGQGEAWHDPPVEDEEQIVSDLGFYPRLVTLAERVWAAWDAPEFESFHQRLLHHKERFFKGLPFPYPEQDYDWWERYKGWTTERGVWKKPQSGD